TANGIVPAGLVVADVTTAAVAARFDLVLAAELVYDRTAFGPLASAIAARLAPGGRALLTDAGRIDSRGFYDALEAAGLRATMRETVVREEGLPVRVRLVEAVAR
ncbi:MAG TPA: hypothetical protein VJ814_10780, partial [Gaiellaceae bacterium]|nr:hypothetical protein [Gaiellaceae bacterium]